MLFTCWEAPEPAFFWRARCFFAENADLAGLLPLWTYGKTILIHGIIAQVDKPQYVPFWHPQQCLFVFGSL
jgi:hypothetical protein